MTLTFQCSDEGIFGGGGANASAGSFRYPKIIRVIDDYLSFQGIYYIWLVVDLHLWKIWVRQLGWLFRIYGRIKMFQTTNQILLTICLPPQIHPKDRVSCSFFPSAKGLMISLERNETHPDPHLDIPSHQHCAFPASMISTVTNEAQRNVTRCYKAFKNGCPASSKRT